MNRRDKICNLVCQKDGIPQLFHIFMYKIRSMLCQIKYGRRFKEFGRGCMLVKPDRIIGMECISIRGYPFCIICVWKQLNLMVEKSFISG